ncbi:DUF4276 family protein [Alterinioella nitratireducens]|uniref:DUF4276 family protein n=1 Tax=Alterinioella nitratireducens TaxID=2735915 RepID=UPI0040596FFA
MGFIFPIVEGHGEVNAVPLLLRRILHEELHVFDFGIHSAYRLPRSRIGRFDEHLEKAVRFGGMKLGESVGGVIIIADSDDDCPVEMHDTFIEFCNFRDFQFPVAFVLAQREYEAWLISCGEEMRAHDSIRDDAPSHDQPEEIGGAKGFFGRRILEEGRCYSETVDQAKFTALLNLDTVKAKCRSFRKLVAEISRLTNT